MMGRKAKNEGWVVVDEKCCLEVMINESAPY